METKHNKYRYGFFKYAKDRDEKVDLDILREMADLNMFTNSEENVLICLLKGMTNINEIAKSLNLSISSVRTYKSLALKKYYYFKESKNKS